MRRPLFWKLLLGSWLTLILVAIGNAMVFRSFLTTVQPWAKEVVQRGERLQLQAASRILQAQGPDGIAEYAAALPSGEQLEIFSGQHHFKPIKDDFVMAQQLVQTPSGFYTLVYRSTGRYLFAPEPTGFFSIFPFKLLAVNFVGVTIFSLLIASYLAGPIQKLRAGLARVAEGDLTVRVSAQLASRRDETSDLARDFDRMAEHLQQLLHAREQLLHHVSHELRSPLTRLLLAVDLARQKPDRLLASLQRIEYEAQRLNEMVGELLTMSRAEFNAAQSETYFSLVDLVAAITADANFEAEPKGVMVSMDMRDQSDDCAGLIINGSPALLRKGIENVVRNAVKVSQSGQTVTIGMTSLDSPVNKVRIEVSDEGPGVPTEALERIFDPFVRLEGQTQSSGFGLGLAIARSAAHAHNGSIWAVNRPASGLTVVFELPVRSASESLPQSNSVYAES